MGLILTLLYVNCLASVGWPMNTSVSIHHETIDTMVTIQNVLICMAHHLGINLQL